MSLKLGRFDFEQYQDLKDFYRTNILPVDGALNLWRENDGVVPLISQYHPDNCR